MTPLQIEILLHYHTRGVDYRDGDFSAPAVREAIDEFVGSSGMLRHRMAAADLRSLGRGDFRTYELTERGQAFVDHIQALPLPECEWRIPTR